MYIYVIILSITGDFCPVGTKYFQHPYECHGYVWCVNGTPFVNTCNQACPNIPVDMSTVSCGACPATC